MPKVVTANLLATGAVVFTGADGGWVDRFADAELFADDRAADQALAAAQTGAHGALVVDPFLAPVETPVDGSAPGGGMSLRDRIRAFGPTVRYGGAADTR